MKVGLVGRPGSGKTTLFSAMTGIEVKPGGGSETRPQFGVIKVPDERVDELAKIFQPKRVVYAEITLADFPRIHGGSGSPGFPPALVNHWKEMECLALILREFDRTEGSSMQEVSDFESEMKLVDLQMIENRLGRLKKEKGHEQERPLLEELKNFVESDRSLRERKWTEEELIRTSGFAFLSLKPLLVLVNIDERSIGAPLDPDLARYLDERGLVAIQISAKLEMELSLLNEEERGDFLKALGISVTARTRFIQTAYRYLDLVSFLTVGPDEVRAWPIPKSTTAVKAAGKIHSDIEKGFIRAEVVSYSAFIAMGSEAKCRETGKLRLEGKDYPVRDGDIIHFRFNV